MRRLGLFLLIVAVCGLLRVPPAHAVHDSCTVGRVIDGDTFVCTDGTHVRMLQMNAQELSDCGGDWARAALANIFLLPGREVHLDHDAVLSDKHNRELAAPIINVNGSEYNVSMVMVYVGLAKPAYYGDNGKYLDWANAAETWARVAQWNMWAPGGPYNGGTNCGTAPVPPPPTGTNWDSAYPTVCIPPPPPTSTAATSRTAGSQSCRPIRIASMATTTASGVNRNDGIVPGSRFVSWPKWARVAA